MKSLTVISVLLPTIVLASASSGEAQVRRVLQPGQLCSDQSNAAITTFEDANLAAAVTAALSVGARDDLTCGQVTGLSELVAREAEIESLAGVQNLTSLTRLDLWDNSITDISPLIGLASLTYLDLSRNSITDLSALGWLTSLTDLYLNSNSIIHVGALSDLTGLTSLYINRNSITDISVLSGLTSLRDLNITYNSISDISTLRGFTDLAVLRLYNNPITDISALRGLTRLTNLHIHDLPDLSDIRPLLNNAGLGAGDRVILFNSNVSCEDALALHRRGVSVGSGCAMVTLRQEWPSILAAVLVVAALLGGAVFVVRRGLRWRRARV